MLGKHKLGDKWHSDPYLVVEKLPDLPVYPVKPEKGRGMVKTLHRDHLLPIGHLVRFPSDLEVNRKPHRIVTRLHQKEKSVENPNQEDEEEHWNLPADRREDILFALDLLADQLSGDVSPDSAITPADVSQHNSAEEEIDVDTEEVVDTTPEGLDTEQTHPLPTDPVGDTGLEGGVPPSFSQSQSRAEPVCNHSAQRQ